MAESNPIGPYEILAPIARGGMGMVYRARDPRAGREVALKILPADSSPAAQRRLLREARALAQLQHPNVVQVHDAGESPQGPWVALELIEGGASLGDRIAERGPLSTDRAAAVAIAIADALQACHSAGILHRDVKPSNVLLGPDDRPLLTDFGLALQSADSLTRLSRDGAILGTPGFFPPEQARGKLDQIDERSDVYGLGATLYALLTGRAPVEGTTLAEVVIATQHQAVTPPSDSRPEVDPDLDRIVLRCLERDPARRYATAGEVADALRAYARGDALGARPRLRRLAAGLAGMALLLGLALAWRGRGDAEPVAAASSPAAEPSASAESTPMSPGTLPFRPPPIGTLTRLRCRFEQTLTTPSGGQAMWFEIVSRGKVVADGDTCSIEGTVTRVSGRLKNRVHDLRFDTDRPDRTTDTARIVAGDLLAFAGSPLRADFAHNANVMKLTGLPTSVKIGRESFDPGALARDRIRVVHGCFPLPADLTKWTRRFDFKTEIAQAEWKGEVRLRCRMTRTPHGLDLAFEADPDDMTWDATSAGAQGFSLQGAGRITDGWVQNAQVSCSFKGRIDRRREPFEFKTVTYYAVELLK